MTYSLQTRSLVAGQGKVTHTVGKPQLLPVSISERIQCIQTTLASMSHNELVINWIELLVQCSSFHDIKRITSCFARGQRRMAGSHDGEKIHKCLLASWHLTAFNHAPLCRARADSLSIHATNNLTTRLLSVGFLVCPFISLSIKSIINRPSFTVNYDDSSWLCQEPSQHIEANPSTTSSYVSNHS